MLTFWLNTTNSSINIFKFNQTGDCNNATMDCLVNDKVVTNQIAKKLQIVDFVFRFYS